MAAKRNLSLTPRKENQRDAKTIEQPIQFSLDEIMAHFTDSLDSVKAQYAVADSLMVSGNTDDSKTIWRSQIVLAEGLLDFYMHEMSKYCLFRMFTGGWERSDKYASFMVPMEKVEEAINSEGSADWFFNYLNNRFSRDVFISKESMREQLNLIGIGFTQMAVRAFPSDSETSSVKYCGEIVEELFRRRNVIAHQNDRSHASSVQNDITKEFVLDYILKIERIVNSIHFLAQEKG